MHKRAARLVRWPTAALVRGEAAGIAFAVLVAALLTSRHVRTLVMERT